ncbi:MAG: PIG-L family deacetylase, partial [Flavobacteriales bacterium]
MSLDILAFGAHPDDVEISCGGTIIRSIEEGKRVGFIDLTSGEMGTRGNETTRMQEATKATETMGLTLRENLHFKDCFF